MNLSAVSPSHSCAHSEHYTLCVCLFVDDCAYVYFSLSCPSRSRVKHGGRRTLLTHNTTAAAISTHSLSTMFRSTAKICIKAPIDRRFINSSFLNESEVTQLTAGQHEQFCYLFETITSEIFSIFKKKINLLSPIHGECLLIYYFNCCFAFVVCCWWCCGFNSLRH